ncbi:MAG: hypothetical protein V1881_01680 [Candidatus Micrarchaeota archaeon]
MTSPFDPNSSEGAAGSVFKIKGSDERERGVGGGERSSAFEIKGADNRERGLGSGGSSLFELKGADAPTHYRLRFGSMRGDAGVAFLLIIALLVLGAFAGAGLPNSILSFASLAISVPFALMTVLSTNYVLLAPIFVLAFFMYWGNLKGLIGGGLVAFAMIAFFAVLAA